MTGVEYLVAFAPNLTVMNFSFFSFFVVVVVVKQTSEISLISNSPLHCSRSIILLTCTWSRKFYLHVSFEVKVHMRSVKRENSAELP